MSDSYSSSCALRSYQRIGGKNLLYAPLKGLVVAVLVPAAPGILGNIQALRMALSMPELAFAYRV
jgi:hypothetical protein